MAQKILQLISKAIAQGSVDRFDTELLLAHTLKKSREFVVAHHDFFVPWIKRFRFQRLVAKRSHGVPIAYLTGHKEFFGLDFLVNKHTLVPRPDTEILVEAVLKEIKNIPAGILIDIGTGTGCIPIAILKNTNQKNIQTFATDISQKALTVARKNARRQAVPIHFLSGNLLTPLFKNILSFENTHCILTANLPYITQEQFDTEPSIQHEPYLALVAPDHGLALYKELLTQIHQMPIDSLLSVTCFFEIDPSQSTLLSKEIQKIFPQSQIHIQKDLSKRDRIIMLHLTKSEICT